MLIDLVKRYKANLNANPALKLEGYKLKDGIYLKLDPEKSWDENLENINERWLINNYSEEKIVIEKHELFEWFLIRDYYSSVLNDDSNKMVDLPARKFHSTNYLTLFIKEDVLLTDKVFASVEAIKQHIESFFSQLEKSDAKIFDVYPITGKTSEEKNEQLQKREQHFQKNYKHLLVALESEERSNRIEMCKKFLLSNLENLMALFNEIKLTSPFKNYIKIFFEAPEADYRIESEIYLLPRIFTTGDYNAITDQSIVGLPSGDMTMNSKKPFFTLKTMETKAPLRIPINEAMIRKDLFKWLEAQGKFKAHTFLYNSIFKRETDTSSRSAYHLSLDANGSIDYFENVPFLKYESIEISIDNVTGIYEKTKDDSYVKKHYEPIHEMSQLFTMFNRLFFRGKLRGNLLRLEPEIETGSFTAGMQTLFLQSRQALYDFFEKGTDLSIKSVIDKLTLNLIAEQLRHVVTGVNLRDVAEAYNVRLALLNYFHIKGGENMTSDLKELVTNLRNRLDSDALFTCESEAEFYYLSGQLAYYLLYQSEAGNRHMGMFEPIMRVKYADQLKKRLDELLMAYGHAINMDYRRFRIAFSGVLGFQSTSKIEGVNREMLLAGLLSDNLFLQKSDKRSDGK